MMETLRTLTTDALLDALTGYYERSRQIVNEGGSEHEYISCRFRIDIILRELQDRRTQNSPDQREDFRSGRSRTAD